MKSQTGKIIDSFVSSVDTDKDYSLEQLNTKMYYAYLLHNTNHCNHNHKRKYSRDIQYSNIGMEYIRSLKLLYQKII